MTAISEPLSASDTRPALTREHMEAAESAAIAYFQQAEEEAGRGNPQCWQWRAAVECIALYNRLRREGVR